MCDRLPREWLVNKEKYTVTLHGVLLPRELQVNEACMGDLLLREWLVNEENTPCMCDLLPREGLVNEGKYTLHVLSVTKRMAGK